VGRDKNVTTDNSVRQISTGSGDNVARDKIIHQNLYGSVDYQQLVQDIKDAEDLLTGLDQDKIDLRLKQAKKVEELNQRLEDFKANVFRLHELFTRIPINTERLRKAKAHFDKGEFREADAVLKAEEIQQDVDRLHKEKGAVKERLAAIEEEVEGEGYRSPLFNGIEEYLDQRSGYSGIVFRSSDGAIRKWQEPRAGQMMTWNEANEYVDKSNQNRLMNHDNWRLPAVGELYALKKFIGDFPDTFFGIDLLYWSSEDFGPYSVEAKVVNLGNAQMKWYDIDQQVAIRPKNNRFSVRLVRTVKPGSALQEYEEALKLYRGLALAEPKAFLPVLANTLLNLSIFYLQNLPDKAKSVAYAQEARDIPIPLCQQAPHMQNYLDKAEQVLAANKAKPEE
jgi:hypothetical protein